MQVTIKLKGGTMRSTVGTSTNQGLPKRLILGFAALVSAAVVGVAGLAGAAPADKPSKTQCSDAGFTNYGQCVREWAQNKNRPANGYGGGSSSSHQVETEVNVNTEGDGNIVEVFINYVFG